MRKLRNNESNLWARKKKQNKENLCSLFTFLSVVGSHRQAGGRGGNVKINVDGIAAKSGRNGGNCGAAQSSSFGASSCGNKVQIATFLCFALVGWWDTSLSRFISLTLPGCRCVRGQDNKLSRGKAEMDNDSNFFFWENLRWSIGRLDCGNLGQWSIWGGHRHYRIKVRLKFLLCFWYFSDVTDRPFSFAAPAIRQICCNVWMCSGVAGRSGAILPGFNRQTHSFCRVLIGIDDRFVVFLIVIHRS